MAIIALLPTTSASTAEHGYANLDVVQSCASSSFKQLEAHLSPEQICGRLVSHGLSAIRLFAETICRFLYSKEEYGLKLYEYFAEMETKRCPRRTRRSRSSRIPEALRIHQRPDFVGNRLQFRNWEGDLIIFDRDLGEANVTTLVERKSRYCVIIKNNSRRSKPIMNKIIQAFAALQIENLKAPI